MFVLAAPSLCLAGRVELRVSAREAFVNEPIVAEVRIHDFQQCDAPVFPKMEDWAVGPPSTSESSSTVIEFGRARHSRTRSFTYELAAKRTGELIIPPISVKVDGKTLKTRPVQILVRASDANELLSAQITCDRERVYVGQQVRLTLTILVKPPVAFGRPLDAGDTFRLIENRRFGFGPFPSPDKYREVKRELSDGSTARYFAYDTRIEHVVDRPGLLDFAGLTIGMSYPTRFGRDIFGDLTVAERRRLRVRPTVTTEVLPLPTAGRPPGFNGAVGSYQISVTAQPTSLRVGDPIQLTIELRGDGPIETLPPPILSTQPQLTELFRVPEESLAGEVVGGRKRFTQIVRAKSAEVSEIPPIEYAYFDPDSENYAVARSEPIPLTVRVAETLEIADLEGIRTATPLKSSPGLEPLLGLRDNETREAVLLATPYTPRLSHVIVSAAVPPAVFLLSWGWVGLMRARVADPARRRRQAAYRTARQRIDRAGARPPQEVGREVAAALAGYLADRLDGSAARFAGRAAAEFLKERGIAEETIARCAALIERCEQASYAAAADADAQAIVKQARQCLSLLERESL